MTEDRDFKNLVRRRAEKTGESYQAARRQLERHIKGAQASARVERVFRAPFGVVIGCVVERGTISRGNSAVVLHDGRPVHEATIAAVRHLNSDIDGAPAGLQCGLLLDPPYEEPAADLVVTIG
jgi:translation initiation factor IF-2